MSYMDPMTLRNTNVETTTHRLPECMIVDVKMTSKRLTCRLFAWALNIYEAKESGRCRFAWHLW